MSLDRRKAILRMSLSAAGVALSPSLISAIIGCEPKKEGTVGLLVFNADQDAELQALTECIIPTTDTPGAIAAGVNTYIDLIFAKVSNENDKTDFVNGLDELIRTCKQQMGKVFSKLDSDKQIEFLKGQESTDFFGTLKAMTISGYYSSEIGASQELAYVHASGVYEDRDYSEFGRSFY